MAEGGVNIEAGERVDEPAGPWPVPYSYEDEMNKIKKIIQEQVDTLKTSLEVSFGPQAESVASGILLRGESLRHMCNDDDGEPIDNEEDINEKIHECREKIPTFLLFIAPVEPNGKRRDREIEYRSQEAKSYMNQYGITEYDNPIVVLDFKEMEKNVKTFVEKRRASEIPCIVFLGHGTQSGKVCFKNEHESPKRFLEALYECHKKYRPKEMPLGQLRVVFAQCYAHMVDADADDAYSYALYECHEKKKEECFPKGVSFGQLCMTFSQCRTSLVDDASDKDKVTCTGYEGNNKGNECIYTLYESDEKTRLLGQLRMVFSQCYAHLVDTGDEGVEYIYDLNECLDKNRTEEMTATQGKLRMVFSQCYAHLVDDAADNDPATVTHTGGEGPKGFEYSYALYDPKGIMLGQLRVVSSRYAQWVPTVKRTGDEGRTGVEYIYLTSPENPTTRTRYRIDPETFSSLEKLDARENDVWLDLYAKDIVFKEELFKSKLFEDTILSKLCQQLLSDEARVPIQIRSGVQYIKERMDKKEPSYPKALEELKKMLSFQKYVHDEYFVPWVLDGPSAKVPWLGKADLLKLTDEVDHYRWEMKRFIVVQYGPIESTHDINDILDTWVKEPFGCLKKPFSKKKERVDSEEAMIKTIGDFIKESEAMAVVIVYGTGSVDKDSKLYLHFSSKENIRVVENVAAKEKVPAKVTVPDKEKVPAKVTVPDKENVPAEEIFEKCIALKERLRMVFCCSVEGKLEWFSNAIPPEISRDSAFNKQLNEYSMAIIGPGPLNRLNQPTL